MKRKMDSGSSSEDESSRRSSKSSLVSSSEASAALGEIAVGVVTSPTFSSLFSVTPSCLSAKTSSCSSIPEEKRAFRKHRRKLARIVAEQWKYIARARLLRLKFRNVQLEQLKRYGFSEWKELAEDRTLKMEDSGEFYRHWLKRRGFRHWTNCVNKSKNIRNLLARTWRNKSRKPFTALRDYAVLRLRQFKRTVTANHYYVISVYSKVFSDWRVALQVQRNKTFYNKVAQEKRAFSQQRWALRAWKHAAAEGIYSDSENSFHSDKAEDNTPENHFRKIRQKHVISAWRKYMELRCELADGLCQHYLLKRARDHWSKYISYRRSRDKKIEAARNYWTTSTLKTYTGQWKTYASCNKQNRIQKEIAWTYSKDYKLRRCVEWLKDYHFCKMSEDEKRTIASSHWKAKLTRSSMQRWHQYLQGKYVKRKQEETADNHRKTNRLRRCVHWWHRFMSDSKIKRDMEQHTRRKVIIAGSFLAWTNVAKASRQKHKIRDEQFVRLKRTLDFLMVSNAWNRWEEFLKDKNMRRIQNRKADEQCNKCRGLSMFHAWRRFTEDERTHAKAKVFYVKLLQRLVLLGWFQAKVCKPEIRESRLELPILKKENNNHAVADTKRVRPAPRRPILGDVRQGSTPDGCSLSGYSSLENITQTYVPRQELQVSRTLNGEMKEISNEVHNRTPAFANSGDNMEELQVVADEIAWMEDILAGFDDVRAELVLKRAELALLLEKDTVGCKETSTKINKLTQKIALLQQRRVLLLPTIQAVSAIVPALRLRCQK